MHGFKVLDGSEDAKSILVETLHTKGAKRTGLQEFITDIEETENRAGKWWLVIDDKENPRGALTVRYINDTSYLRAIWTKVLKIDDVKVASKKLLDAWISNANAGIRKFQADLPGYSPLITGLEEVGFMREKLLLASYEVPLDWPVEDLPDDYIMRGIEEEELPTIYHRLVKSDLDPDSPIFVNEKNFTNFYYRVPPEVQNTWTVVEDATGKMVGFGASVPNFGGKPDKNGNRTVILFGPHSTESAVLRSMIGETMVYWKSRGYDKMRIIRVNELYPSVVKHFDLDLRNTTTRYTLSSHG